MRQHRIALAALVLAIPAAASADVTEAGEAGFSTHAEALVAASPAATWAVLIDPAKYWSSQHSWSGDAANMTLDARAGGCFCETLPAKEGRPAGSVEHMRVIYAGPWQLLRMRGALGPLQSEGLSGTLTVTLTPVVGGTRVEWDYVVGGHARFGLAQVAPAVDGVLTEQLGHLADLLGRMPQPPAQPAK